VEDRVEQGNLSGGAVYHARIDGAGRVTLPAELRQRQGWAKGRELVVFADAHGVRLTSIDEAVLAMQAACRVAVARDRSLVDELLAERRDEAARDG
jgi:bifunctional DNA-binding transcriptional regulator/antitoxin component of YhaV-PrlF toxin-antitoxin module